MTSTVADERSVPLTTRSLLVCVVLGAFTAVLLHVARLVGVLFLAAAPWLGSPSALIPWFCMIIVAALLIPRFGSALITSIVGTIAGVGTMSLVGGLVVELVFFIARTIRKRGGKGTLEPGDRAGLSWSIVAGIGVGLVSYAILFTVKEFTALPVGLILAGLRIRLVAAVVYGWLSYIIVQALLNAGFDPIGPGRRTRVPQVDTGDSR